MFQFGELLQARKASVEAMWDYPLVGPVKKLQSAAHKMLTGKIRTAKATAIAKAMNREEQR